MTDKTSDAPADTGTTAMRLLIPIDATERSRWGVRYALRQHQVGKPVQACLLFVAEPATSLELLRFRTHDEIARFQAESGQYLIEDAADPLVRAGIPYEAVLREGEVAFQILDAAEQLGCSNVVLPQPQTRLARLLCRDVAHEVLSQARGVPIVTVNVEGMPVGSR